MPWNCRRWKYFGQKAAKRCYKFSEEISWNSYSKCSTQTCKDIKEKQQLFGSKICYAFLVMWVIIGIVGIKILDNLETKILIILEKEWASG